MIKSKLEVHRELKRILLVKINNLFHFSLSFWHTKSITKNDLLKAHLICLFSCASVHYLKLNSGSKQSSHNPTKMHSHLV